jgi:hypothetical protein
VPRDEGAGVPRADGANIMMLVVGLLVATVAALRATWSP